MTGRAGGEPPQVTIGLPVFNGARYLDRAIESALAQDFADLELVVVDNCSTDATPDIVATYAERDPRVRYHRNPRNIGAAPNFCEAFRLGRGRYFKWLAYDDWMEPDFLRRSVEVLDAEPRTVLVFSGTTLFDEHGAAIGHFRYPDGLCASNAARRFHHSLWSFKYATAVFGLFRARTLSSTRLIQPYCSSDRFLLSEVALLGEVRQLDGYLLNSTETISVRSGRGPDWWRSDVPVRPSFDRWRFLDDLLALVVRTPGLDPGERVAMATSVLGFFARRWPRRALYQELRSGLAHRSARSALGSPA